jgi:hypothetical protein
MQHRRPWDIQASICFVDAINRQTLTLFRLLSFISVVYHAVHTLHVVLSCQFMGGIHSISPLTKQNAFGLSFLIDGCFCVNNA